LEWWKYVPRYTNSIYHLHWETNQKEQSFKACVRTIYIPTSYKVCIPPKTSPFCLMLNLMGIGNFWILPLAIYLVNWVKSFAYKVSRTSINNAVVVVVSYNDKYNQKGSVHFKGKRFATILEMRENKECIKGQHFPLFLNDFSSVILYVLWINFC
jgi:hypothetical protein